MSKKEQQEYVDSATKQLEEELRRLKMFKGNIDKNLVISDGLRLLFQTAALGIFAGPTLAVLGEEFNNLPVEILGGFTMLYALAGFPGSIVLKILHEPFDDIEEYKKAISKSKEAKKSIEKLKNEIKQAKKEAQKR